MASYSPASSATVPLCSDCCWHNVHHRCRIEPPDVTRSTLDPVTCDVTCCSRAGQSDERYLGFGSAYYDRLCELIDKYLELGTADNVCYIGDSLGGEVAPMLTERYCLIKPVTVIDSSPRQPVGETSSQSVEDVFSLQFSRTVASGRYDKIILFASLQQFTDLTTAILRLIKELSDNGLLLIIHRPAKLITIPVPPSVLEKLRLRDIPLERIISVVDSLGLNLRWAMENAKVITSRQNWIDLLSHGFPLDTFPGGDVDESDRERTSAGRCEGIRELLAGVLRYQGTGNIEFTDRMVFITVSRPSAANAAAQNSREKLSRKTTNKFGLFGPLEMEVTAEIKELLDARPIPTRPNLF